VKAIIALVIFAVFGSLFVIDINNQISVDCPRSQSELTQFFRMGERGVFRGDTSIRLLLYANKNDAIASTNGHGLEKRFVFEIVGKSECWQNVHGATHIFLKVKILKQSDYYDGELVGGVYYIIESGLPANGDDVYRNAFPTVDE